MLCCKTPMTILFLRDHCYADMATARSRQYGSNHSTWPQHALSALYGLDSTIYLAFHEINPKCITTQTVECGMEVTSKMRESEFQHRSLQSILYISSVSNSKVILLSIRKDVQLYQVSSRPVCHLLYSACEG